MHGKHVNTLLFGCMSPNTKLKTRMHSVECVQPALVPATTRQCQEVCVPFHRETLFHRDHFFTETPFSQKSLHRDTFIETTLPFTETPSPSQRLPLLQRDPIPPLIRDPLWTETPWKEHRTTHRDPLKKYGTRQPDRK